MIEGKNVSKAFDGRVLFDGVNFTVKAGERIALIGDNGTGKSTLVKAILGEESLNGGSVSFGPAARQAYLPQVVQFADMSRSLVDTLIYEQGCTPQTARDRLGAFAFYGEDVFKPISVLSGGERSRLRLCMLMEGRINLLVLDEPTNHLDIQSREWMEEVLDDYDEALLFVSHDRYFVSRFATRIWTLEDGQISDFYGTYEEYKEKRANEVRFQQIEKTKQKPKSGKMPKGQSIEKRLEKQEKEIAALEEKAAMLDQEIEQNASDYEALISLQTQKEALDAMLKAAYQTWEELAEQQ